MKRKRKAELCDAIILKFEGNKSFYWDDLHGHKKAFNDIVMDADCGNNNPSPEDKYFKVIEPLVNLLVSDGILKRNNVGEKDPYLNLTDKGFSTFSDIKELGYITKYKGECKKRIWRIALGMVSIATFILVAIRFYHDFILPK